MRIISGSYRGRQIHPPKGFRARPTTDFAKESLFNILSNHYDFEDLEVLDLFGGTGSISYEFVSRGVRSVLCLEQNDAHYRFIRKTLLELDMDEVNLIRGDAFRFLKKPPRSFDVIFADPPYDHPKLDSIPELVLGTGVLASGGVLILEHPGSFSFSAHPGFTESRKYGGVNFSFFRQAPI